MQSADPNKTFEGVKEQLCKKCQSLKGDTVINCEFEYCVAVADRFMSKNKLLRYLLMVLL